MDFASRLGMAQQCSDQYQKQEFYRQLLAELFTQKSTDESVLKHMIDHIITEDVAQSILRVLLQDMAISLPNTPHSFHKNIATYLLSRIQPRVISFEEQVSNIREGLAEVYIAEENWSEAARTLVAIPLDSGNRMVDDTYKARIYVKIARLYLENDDTVQAESYITRSSVIISNCQDKDLQLAHKVCFARILDGKRRFLDAAIRYLEISNLVGAEEQLQSLEYGTICAILAGAGPKRSQVLSRLFKDERCAKLELYPVLEKVFFDRLLAKSDVERLTTHLKPHHTAITSDGTTVLDRAVVEHNLSAASKLYQNISLQQLGILLQVDKEKAEKVAAKMISEERLTGTIDQITGFIHFEEEQQAMRHWDQQIEELCLAVSNVAKVIRERKASSMGN